MHRLRGVVANASRCSHAELEVAEELDEGNPDELGTLVGGFRKPYPHFNIVGGCCKMKGMMDMKGGSKDMMGGKGMMDMKGPSQGQTMGSSETQSGSQ
jgi:hypothetical protein